MGRLRYDGVTHSMIAVIYNAAGATTSSAALPPALVHTSVNHANVSPSGLSFPKVYSPVVSVKATTTIGTTRLTEYPMILHRNRSTACVTGNPLSSPPPLNPLGFLAYPSSTVSLGPLESLHAFNSSSASFTASLPSASAAASLVTCKLVDTERKWARVRPEDEVVRVRALFDGIGDERSGVPGTWARVTFANTLLTPRILISSGAILCAAAMREPSNSSRTRLRWSSASAVNVVARSSEMRALAERLET